MYTKNLNGVLAECCYVAQFERSYMTYRFGLYRTATEWKLQAVHLDPYDNDKFFATLPLKSVARTAVARTAQKPEVNRDEETEAKFR